MTEYNKVVYDGQTLIDLTQDDVQASDVRNGVYFHSADGVRSQGTLASTSVPTADTIAEWDSDSHMNSEDMTSQEVEDFVDGLNVSGGGVERASIPSSSFSFESGHGSGTIGGDGLHIVKFGEMICFYGQINASSFVKGTSGTPYVQTAKPSFMPADKVYSPVGICRSGSAGSGTPSASAWSLRDRIWIVTDSTYLHIRSANFLGDSANGYLEMMIFGAMFHIDGAF